MRILSPIVCTQALVVASRQSQFGLRCGIRTQPVSYQHVRREAVLFEQLAHQFHGCSLVSPWLHQQIENLAFVVDRAPQPEPPARNRHGHLVEMPPRRWPWASMAKLSGEQRPEFQNPSSHRFVGDIQTALGEQILDVAIAEREADIEPNGVPDDRRRESGGGQMRSSSAILPVEPQPATVPVTTPAQVLAYIRKAPPEVETPVREEVAKRWRG